MTSKTFRNAVLALLAVFALAALAGCSSVSVNYDYDTQVDFNTYRTYGWLGGRNLAPGKPAGTRLSGDLLENRILEAVDYEMAQRNITRSDDADLLVKYHIGAEDKVQVTDWGYRYSDYYWGYGGRQIDAYQYTQGTLVLDIIDARTKTLIWRGSGVGTVDGKQRPPEEMQQRMNKIVAKILENFPPSRK